MEKNLDITDPRYSLNRGSTVLFYGVNAFFFIMRSSRRLGIDSNELAFSLTSLTLAHTKRP